MQINGSRLRESVLSMAQIGATSKGGVTRLALSLEDKQARDLFCHWLRETELDVKVDDVGNIFGWRYGKERTLPPVLFGSHLDTVLRGGKFDGALGTLAALEVVRSLNDANIQTRRTVGVVAFTAEEGGGFEPSILGSSVIAEKFSEEHVYALRNRTSGATFGEELERIGYKGEKRNRPPIPSAFLELHIEQGPVLVTSNLEIGIVEGIVGILWLEVVLEGQVNHAGPSPMAGRRDALVGAARVIHRLRDLALLMGESTVATVGRLEVEPNLINIIPGRVILGVDIRNIDSGMLDQTAKMFNRIVQLTADEERLGWSVDEVGNQPVTQFDASLVSMVEASTRDRGFSYRNMISRAGHDSLWMSRICPTAMIFVPSVDGKSHCEDEETDWDQAAAGASVLATTVLRLAQK